MTLPLYPQSGKKSLHIQYFDRGQKITRTLTAPKLIRTMEALLKAKSKGITALELSNTWALRLGAYVFDLRHDYGLKIITRSEKHPEGWHGRYVLMTPVTVVE
jgi:hypothetical protein